MSPAFHLLFLLAGLVTGYSTSAQTLVSRPAAPAARATCTSVSGYVTHDSQPLVGVSVMVRNTALLTTTNSEGYFVLPLRNTDPSELFFDAAGYEPQFLPVTCQPIQLELRLLPGTRIRQRGKRKGQIKKLGAAPAPRQVRAGLRIRPHAA